MARSSTTFQKGHSTSDSVREKISKTLLGRSVSPRTTFKKGHKINDEVRAKISRANKGRKFPMEVRVRFSIERSGGKWPYTWKGGISKENMRIRKSFEARLWRERVFERDAFTCQFCGIRGGKLNADHIKPFSQYPELRFDISNGRTLCVSCHRKTPTYGNRRQ